MPCMYDSVVLRIIIAIIQTARVRVRRLHPGIRVNARTRRGHRAVRTHATLRRTGNLPLQYV